VTVSTAQEHEETQHEKHDTKRGPANKASTHHEDARSSILLEAAVPDAHRAADERVLAEVPV
jgi:hypothetical protein